MTILVIITIISLSGINRSVSTFSNYSIPLAINALSMLDELGDMHGNLLEYIDGEVEEEAEYFSNCEAFELFKGQIAQIDDQEVQEFVDTLTKLYDSYVSESRNIFKLYDPREEAWAREKVQEIEFKYSRPLEIKLDFYKEDELADVAKTVSLREAKEDDIPGVRYYLELIDQAGDLTGHLYKYINGNLDSKVLFYEDAKTFELYLEKLKPLEQTKEELEAIAEIESLYKEIKTRSEEMFNRFNPKNKTDATAKIDFIEHNLLSRMEVLIYKIAEEQREVADADTSTVNKQISRTTNILIFLILITIGISVIASLAISNNLFKRLGAAPIELEKILAVDDYNEIKIPEVENPEGIHKAIIDMLTRLKDNVFSVIEAQAISLALTDISQAFASVSTWEDALGIIGIRTQDSMKSAGVILLRFSKENQSLVNTFSYPDSMKQVSVSTSDELIIRLKNKRIIKDEHFKEYAKELIHGYSKENVSHIMVPIVNREELWGALLVFKEQRNGAISEAEIDALRLVAQFIGANIFRTETLQSLVNSEKNAQTILANSGEGMVICDEEFQVQYTNETFGNIVKGKPEDYLQTSIVRMFDSKNVDSFREWFRQIKTNNSNGRYQGNVFATGGVVKSVEIKGVVIEYNNQSNKLLLIRDITEQKKQEAEIKKYSTNLENLVQERTMQLESANAELESFSYSVSHDLRAPLRAIVGYANFMKEEEYDRLDEDGKLYIDKIHNNTLKMGQLIDEILSFSRLQRSEVSFHKINIHKLFTDELQLHQQQFPKKKIEFVVDDIPDIFGTPTLLAQVVHNLVSNAVKYSSTREKILIHVGGMNEEDEYVYFVKDNGVGFNAKYKDKLFKVFQRLHSDKEFEGTGVGLAFVHKILTKHNGRIWAESELNNGATFYFTIPEPINND